MDNNAVFTTKDFELLKRISPELFAAVQANERFSRQAAQAALVHWKIKQHVAYQTGDVTPENPSLIQLPTVQIPQWPDSVRAVPNGFLRSALFGAIRKGRRPYLEGKKLAAIAGIEVTYTGPRLDQGDLDVWEAILHALQGKDMGMECRTTSYQLLRLMDLKDTGENRRLLKNRIYRLRANAVEIKQGRYTYIGGLLERAARDEKTQEWVIVLDPNLAALFAADQYTQLQWGVRRTLSGQPLAQWLYGFYSSHAAPLPIKVETLYRLSGSEAGELKTFTQKMKKALDAVTRACAASGESFKWVIEDGLVYVTRTPTKAQRRHLTRHEK